MAKVLKKFRSTSTIYEDYSVEVTPMLSTGEKNQKDVVEVGGGKMYTTRGQKKQTRCVHLTVDAKSEDPVRELYRQLDDLIAQARKDGQELPEYRPQTAPRGSLLESNTDYVCALNETKGRIEISATIDLSRDVDYSEKLFRIYSQLSKCLHYNEDSLKRLCRQLAKSGRA